MIRKVMFATVFIGLMIFISSCSKPAPPAPPKPTSTATPSSTTAISSTTPAPQEVQVTGKWELVGKEGDWKGTVDMVGMDGFIWSVEADGSLYKTDPATGNFTQVGDKGAFTKLKLIEGMDHVLWTVEGDSLYKSDPATGKWERMGEGGGWARTIDMVGLNGILYSVEPDGSLWKTDKNGVDTLIDKGGFKGVTNLTEMGGKLWTIEEGTLYQTDPSTLKWSQIGKEGDFANITVMEGTGNFIWMIDSSGNLFKTDKDGAKTKLGDDYGATKILTTLNGKLWTVENNNLYKTN
ncbi:MAG: hypothetical protein QOK48_2196 [Blastocatellia bacterium]|nr:hypothetical protein [Blastocatellia bacterium]